MYLVTLVSSCSPRISFWRRWIHFVRFCSAPEPEILKISIDFAFSDQKDFCKYRDRGFNDLQALFNKVLPRGWVMTGPIEAHNIPEDSDSEFDNEFTD